MAEKSEVVSYHRTINIACFTADNIVLGTTWSTTLQRDDQHIPNGVLKFANWKHEMVETN